MQKEMEVIEETQRKRDYGAVAEIFALAMSPPRITDRRPGM